MVKEGTFFFTKKLKTSLTPKKGVELGAKGHWVGILLGHAPLKSPMPTDNQFSQLLGAIGLVGLDDVEEALGKVQMQKVIDHVQKKYQGET